MRDIITIITTTDGGRGSGSSTKAQLFRIKAGAANEIAAPAAVFMDAL